MHKTLHTDKETEQQYLRAFFHEQFAAAVRTYGPISQSQFARMIGVSPTLISLLRSGKKSISHKLIQKISDALSLEVPSQLVRTHNRTCKCLEIPLLLDDWIDFRILAFISYSNCELDIQTLSSSLRIQPTNVHNSLNRLRLLGIRSANRQRLCNHILKHIASTQSLQRHFYKVFNSHISRSETIDTDMNLSRFVALPPADLKRLLFMFSDMISQQTSLTTTPSRTAQLAHINICITKC